MALSPLLPGTRLAPDGSGGHRYRVERELGSGGFGITYDAVHVGLGRRVVIKELACDAVSRRDVDSRRVFALTHREVVQQRIQKRFLDEARLLARLADENCPHIVRVSDVFEENGTAYYVMDRIDTSGHVPSEPLPGVDGLRRALRLGRELLVALEVAHRWTTLHGDIKPANLLLDSQDRLVLIDFGTARTDEDFARTLATTMHTLGYAPPELMSGPRLPEAGACSDLYSWAMVVYGLLWRHPWQVQDRDGRLVAWPLDPLSRLTAVEDPYGDLAFRQMCGRGVPEQLSKLICSCLSLNPVERPQKVSTFLLEFDRAMQSGVSIKNAGSQAGRPPVRPDTLVEQDRPFLAKAMVAVGTPQAGAAAPSAQKRAANGTPGSLHWGWPLVVGILVATIMILVWIVWRQESGPLMETAMVEEGTTPGTLEGSTPLITPDAGGRTVPPGFVYIPPGTFLMGSPPSEDGRTGDETPQQVTLTTGFYLQRTEVTQGEWQALMGNSPSYFSNCGAMCPVEMVSWLDAARFANSRSQSEGLPTCYDDAGLVQGGGSIYACLGYRLPTESEWEYAARAGTTPSRYGVLDEVGWYAANSESRTHPVGQLTANAWGVYDMLGNVWEWTNDWYGEYGGAVTDPSGPPSGTVRVLRGGSWFGYAQFSRAANRFSRSPDYRSGNCGFRLARSAP